ncbi:hypothetical protein MFIFM68171_03186 [Madurella fahalii]|uniref:Uncharacterized protein n=1 Tax=Madurella fahalii TaxID=1157608 RepID=A0ABQ0G5E3_9PEZI
MFSVLPDLTPRDSHSLWYTSSRNPTASYPFSPLDSHALSTAEHGATANPAQPAAANNNNNNNPSATRPGASASRSPAQASASAIERSLLGRLRADELLADRRRAAVGNMGCAWLKPPGVSKTLFQLREERREAEEHAEAVRREMMAQELAEAEAEAAAQAAQAAQAAARGGQVGGEMDMMMAVEDEMEGDEEEEDDMMGAGGRDLDEDIPDADEGGFGYDGVSDEDDEEEIDQEEEEEVEDDEEEGSEDGGAHETSVLDNQRRVQNRELADRMANMRATEDRMRQMMARGGQQGSGNVGGDLYGAEEDIDEEDQAQILEEEDLVGGAYGEDEVEPGLDMDMEANLDDDIPEAESGGGYEHTDSEAELSSDDGGGHDLSYRRSSQILHHRSSLRRSGGPRSSLDISGFLSRDGSSFMGSSPHVGRRDQ